ncbi:MAG: hypothetical protein ACJ71N_06510 [Terriglobales bacterium]|jgi:hypothetical protein
MRSLRLSSIVLAGILVSCTHGLAADEKLLARTPDGGSITQGNLYENPAIGMSIPLEGSWQFFEQEDQERMGIAAASSHPPANCAGPLCQEAIKTALITKPSPLPPFGTIFLIAYKLEPKYLDRQKYPLYKFADVMMRGSLPPDQSAAEPMTEIKLSGHPAYRQRVKQAGSDAVTNIGYVFENKGYVVLMVAAAPTEGSESKLQAAIEKMKLQ